ncbi:hypothetical protein [Nocardia suismassiliense]|uniref:hypothetical protein n=1 Tax=Nocardia suismassiliense TaxID=2077092 RepID=UPI00131EFFD7|nr:hypothetical protein [Nocardia suismassiliense]
MSSVKSAVRKDVIRSAWVAFAAAVMFNHAGGRRRPRFTWAVIALAGVLVSSCGSAIDPAHAKAARDVESILGQMPGVHRTSITIGDNFSGLVVLTEEASVDQINTVIKTFHDWTAAAPELQGLRADIEVRRRDEKSSFKVGKHGFATAADHTAQWHALSHAFPEDELRWTYQWSTHLRRGYGPDDTISEGADGVGDIALNLDHAGEFKVVGDAYRRLMRDFPELSNAAWQIKTSAPESGLLQIGHRYPTELELSVWDRLNADQNPAHKVLMHLKSTPSREPAWPDVIERLQSRDFQDAKMLAEKHIPIVAELLAQFPATTELGSRGVSYLASSDPRDSLASYHHDRGLRITLGNCHIGDDPPTPAELPLVKRYGVTC